MKISRLNIFCLGTSKKIFVPHTLPWTSWPRVCRMMACLSTCFHLEDEGKLTIHTSHTSLLPGFWKWILLYLSGTCMRLWRLYLRYISRFRKKRMLAVAGLHALQPCASGTMWFLNDDGQSPKSVFQLQLCACCLISFRFPRNTILEIGFPTQNA